ncbi:hypothetical protein COT12_01995 [Candidatus Berkelbacteria bacterium CG08_land_8_20_14_0_20_39_8]|uniref:NodB homology domain-containing protein n=1 Tax=Candidatus Berkelbacteria bacterium CG08_land_8_20_14_0_20_39_8 TaxID=1974511 RepID=A0A2M6YC34_9BACT|nr:MAG: hypothetical protein COT12_01995 [Candidatus Berkelbacteria bacterium CG08_land_8_20_14_0_20_39_8]
MITIKNFFKKNRIVFLLLALFFLILAIVIPFDLKSLEKINPQNPQIVKISQAKVSQHDSRTELSVPILMYHHIRNYNDPNDKLGTDLSVSTASFKFQIDYLKNNGFSAISFESWLNFPNKKLPKKPIILTFDDGYSDAFDNVLPILEADNQIGTFYIISGFVGKEGFLNTDQIKKMSEMGMEIGSHSVDHPNLATASPEKLSQELSNSKSLLEQIIGKKIIGFCYPSGDYNPEVEKAVENAGYLTSTTTNSGISTTKNDKFSLPRLRIGPTTTNEKFMKILSTFK